MARVTIEDCVDKVEDRFELVALAAQRAKSVAAGSDLTIERKGEKDTVLALREIGDEQINVEKLRRDLIKTFQRETEADDPAATEEKELSELDSEIQDEIGEFIEPTGADAIGSEKSEFSFADENIEIDD